MTINEPNITDTGRCGASEAARLLKVSRTTINNWARTGALRFSISRRSGRMYFTGRDIKACWRTI